MEVDLQKMFERCLQEVGGNRTRAMQRFLIAAKKEKPDVTMQECMAITGHTSEDEKKAINLAQKFRTTVFNPIRDHIAKVKFNVADPNQIFGRSGDGKKRSKEQIALRRQILGQFPAMTKTSAAGGSMDHIADLIE